MNFTFENEDANEPNQSEDVSESVDNYEDKEFDESSDEEVGLNVVLKGTYRNGKPRLRRVVRLGQLQVSRL